MAYETEIAAAAAKWKIDPKLGTAVMLHESDGGRPFAIGDGGRAVGLMQTHLVAAQDVNLATEWGKLHEAVVTEDEETAVTLALDIGFAYLAKMLRLFNGNIDWALAAYNQGPTVIGAARDYALAVNALLAKA